MKHDIQSQADIKLMVDEFYLKVLQDATLAHIFNDVANVNWEQHMPVMYAFWSSLLLDAQSYVGNPMIKHIALSKRTPMTHKEFTAWLTLFKETVDTLFEGEVAQEAKSRAEQIARLMEHKIMHDE